MAYRQFYDVIVIGAGPAGNLCAYLTAKAGLSTLVLEEHAAAGLFVNCTGIIGTEAFERLDLPQEPILSSLQTVTFYAPSGTSFRYDPGKPLAYVVSRLKFDQALANLAASQGAEFHYDYHARSIQIDVDCAVVRQNEEDISALRARIVVIATGFGSNLASQVGLAGPKEIVYGAQAEVEMESLKDIEIYLGRAIAPGAFAWVVPLSKSRNDSLSSNGHRGQARIGLTVSKEAPSYFRKFLLHPAIRPRLKTVEPTMLLSPIPVKPMERSCADRVLVVGEAAGQVKTTTQGGIYYGMLCAVFAAQTIQEAVHKKDFSSRFLRRYERLWMKTVGPELKAGWNLRQLFSSLSDEQIDALVELGTRDDIMGLVRRLAHFDWHRNLILSSLKLPALQEVAQTGLW